MCSVQNKLLQQEHILACSDYDLSVQFDPEEVYEDIYKRPYNIIQVWRNETLLKKQEQSSTEFQLDE